MIEIMKMIEIMDKQSWEKQDYENTSARNNLQQINNKAHNIYSSKTTTLLIFSNQVICRTGASITNLNLLIVASIA